MVHASTRSNCRCQKERWLSFPCLLVLSERKRASDHAYPSKTETSSPHHAAGHRSDGRHGSPYLHSTTSPPSGSTIAASQSPISFSLSSLVPTTMPNAVG